APPRGAGCHGRSGGRWRARARGPRCPGARRRRRAALTSVKKESRLRVPTSRFQEAAETIKGQHAGGGIPGLGEVQESQK
uniref:MYCBP associated protein n=1 Tax=Microcebus murinus TaxID=30608 RepID=A0A8C5XYP1_MICMU